MTLLATETAAAKTSSPDPVNIMGVRVVPFESLGQAVECVSRNVNAGCKAFWAAVNPQKIYRAWHDPAVRRVLEQADAGIVDGVGVCWASKALTGWFLPRCTGCDLFFSLLEHAQQTGWRVFLLGASAESNARAAASIRKRFPDLVLAGRCDGYFRNDAAVVEQINASCSDIVFVAMGSPRQEFWIAEHRDELNAKFFLGVGGSFDVAAGMARRAPSAMRRVGLEFLYQLLTQPKRWRRQIVYIPFVWRVIAESFRRRRAAVSSANPTARCCKGACDVRVK